MVDVKAILAPKKLPLLNEPFLVGRSNVWNASTPTKKTFMEFFKKSPEAIGIFSKIVKDINSTIRFKPLPGKKGQGRPKKASSDPRVEGANLFSRRNFLKRELQSQLLDWLVTGEFFAWIGKVDGTKMAKMFSKEDLSIVDEDFSKYNLLRTVPSTTMRVDFDKTGVTNYVQEVNESQKVYNTDEIIHGRFMHLDGKANGFSPFRSAYSIIQTIGLIKDYAGNFFAGGGIPDIIFSFPEEMMENPSYRKISQVIQEYSNAQRQGTQKRGHLVLTGKLDVHELNKFDKDMEFRQLLLTYVGILAFTFQMPASMLKAILGGEVKESSGGTDISDSGYWRNIKDSQEYIEELYNSQFWRPYFGVEMFFEKRYLIDEIKESQNLLFVGDVIAKHNSVLSAYDMKVSVDTVMRRLGYEDSDLQELTPEEKAALEVQKNPPDYRQQQPTNQQAQRGQATQQYSDTKKAEQEKKKV